MGCNKVIFTLWSVFDGIKTYLPGSKGAVWASSILSLEENNYFLKLEKLQYPKTPVLTLLSVKRYIKMCVIIISFPTELSHK